MHNQTNIKKSVSHSGTPQTENHPQRTGETLADKFDRLDADGAFSGNPKYDAALSRLANTQLSDDELKAIYGSKWQQYK